MVSLLVCSLINFNNDKNFLHNELEKVVVIFFILDIFQVIPSKNSTKTKKKDQIIPPLALITFNKLLAEVKIDNNENEPYDSSTIYQYKIEWDGSNTKLAKIEDDCLDNLERCKAGFYYDPYMCDDPYYVEPMGSYFNYIFVFISFEIKKRYVLKKREKILTLIKIN